MQIVNASTPANFFHVIRRQLKRKFRKPLIIFTPKSLLRLPACVSPLDDFVKGGFKELIDDHDADPKLVKRVIFCTGKIYYDLLEEKQKKKLNDSAIVRIEQIYPLPYKQIKSVINKYSNTEDWVWAQEEPFNMGAWQFLKSRIKDLDIRLVARPASGSTATGSSKFHAIRQQKIIEKAFLECDCPLLDQQCKMICIGNRWRSFDVQIHKLGEKGVNAKTFSATKKA